MLIQVRKKQTSYIDYLCLKTWQTQDVLNTKYEKSVLKQKKKWFLIFLNIKNTYMDFSVFPSDF